MKVLYYWIKLDLSRYWFFRPCISKEILEFCQFLTSVETSCVFSIDLHEGFDSDCTITIDCQNGLFFCSTENQLSPGIYLCSVIFATFLLVQSTLPALVPKPADVCELGLAWTFCAGARRVTGYFFNEYVVVHFELLTTDGATICSW